MQPQPPLSDEDKFKIMTFRQNILPHLDAIMKFLPPGYKMTVVARHQQDPVMNFVVTEDLNLEEVANCVLRAEVM